MDMQLHEGPDGSVYLIEVDWPDSAYQRIAAQYSAILNTHVTVLSPGDPTATGYNGFRVKTAGGFHADVRAMLVNWRLALVPVGVQHPVPKRYWCYAGRDGLSLAL